MTSQKTAAAQPQQPKTDLSTHYRPLALKAVLAAALMLKKSAPLKKKTA